MTADPAIVDRIRKLLALSRGSGATPAEAAAAAAAAVRLAEKYRLELAGIQGTDGEARRDDRPLCALPRQRLWASVLACELARLNGCIIVAIPSYRVRDGRKREAGAELLLVGRAPDMAVSRYLYDYATREIDRLCSQRPSKRHEPAYRLGAAEAFLLRVEEARTEARRGHSTTAIVLVDQRLEEANAVVHELPTRRKQARVSKSAESARSAGRVAGWTIPLVDALDEGKSTAALPHAEREGTT